MPKDKDFKRLVRTRMAWTGERYTDAAAALDTRTVRTDVADHRQPLDLLATASARPETYATLKALSPEALLPLAVDGTRHPDWRVRRVSCRLLDDLAFTPESLAALTRCAEDAEPRVRRAAVHSLSCEHCKPEGCTVDLRGVYERALADASRHVREMAVGPLTYGPDEQWRVDLLSQVASGDPSPKLRALAAHGLARIEGMRTSDRQRRALPAALLARTERHRGKWVAIRDDRIIEVGRHPGAMQRRARRQGFDDVRLYWVAPPAD